MIPKASLYDRYRLTNSTAIPQFQGSAGPEAIQVGAHLQGLYDNAQQGGNGSNVHGLYPSYHSETVEHRFS